MKKENGKKLIELYKSGHTILHLADTDDFYGWVKADSINEKNLSMSFEIVDFYINLEDPEYDEHHFKVYTAIKKWHR